MGDEETARQVGQALATELLACGIQCNFAPVVDVATNPKNPVIGDRALSDDPEAVGRLGAALIRGLQQAGVAATAKHFPGHGDTSLDSHHELPVVDHSPGRLEDVELRPFRKAVEAGVALVMTAHVLVRELDPERPATLSPRLVDGLLRKDLGFGGVVVTDDCEMGALAKRWRPAEIAVLAAQAGCDLVQFCARPDAQVEALEGMIRAAESELIGWVAMDEACARIRSLKQRFLLPYKEPSVKAARAAAGRPEHVALAQQIADRSGLSA